MSTREQLVRWIEREQALLWNQLETDLRNAIGGGWSIGALNTAVRAVEAARLVGPTGRGEVPWVIDRSGIYDALLRLGGMDLPPYDPAELARLDALMDDGGRARDRGYSSAQIPEMWARRLEPLLDPESRTYRELRSDLWPEKEESA